MKNILSLLVAVATMVGYAANTWYVDDNNYKKDFTAADYIAAGFDGTDKAKAFGTIQAAIDAASTKANDTILVCPGEYNQGVSNLVVQGSDCGACRINAHKSVRIESIEGAEKTHIVGAWDPDTETGRGPKAIRCIGNYWTTPTFKGFTLRNGATQAVLKDNGKDEADVGVNRGGAAYTWRGASPIYVVDCVVSNCSSSQGTFRNGSVIRSLVCDNIAYTCAGGMQTIFYSSIITRNQSPSSWILNNSPLGLVHCTVYGNNGYRAILNATNSVNNIVELSSTSSDPTHEFSGKVVAGNVCGMTDGIYNLAAPAAGDFRVVEDSRATSAPVAEGKDGSLLVYPVPEEFRNTDFRGNPIPETGFVAGALQEKVMPKGGAIQFDSISKEDIIEVNGHRNIRGGTYAHSVEYPCQFQVKTCFKKNKLFAWNSNFGDFYMESDASRSLYMMPPPQVGVVMTNSPLMVKKEIWLDPVNGNDTDGDGSKSLPYRTLKKGTESTSSYTIIYCDEGTYNEGVVESWGVNNRIWSNQRSVKFVGLKGAAKTIIEGAADGNAPVASQQGCGPAAIRGIAVQGGYFGMEGFTFRNCHTDAKEEGETEEVGHQGGCFRSSGSSAIIMDSIAESSCGSASGNFVGCRLFRCHLKGLKGTPGSAFTTFSGCVIEDCSQSEYWPSSSAYHTALRNSGTLSKNFACIGMGGLRVLANTNNFAGNIMHDYNAYSEGGAGYVTNNPQFVSAIGPKILRSSPAFTCGEVPTDKNYGTNYYIYASTDYYGRPITFIDGKPVAGADMLGVFSMFDKRGLEVTAASAKVVQLQDGKIDLPAGCSLSAGIPATESEVKEYFITVTVADGAELEVTLDGAASTYGSGTHLLRVKSLSAARDIVFSSIGGLVEIESIKRIAGMYLILR